MAEPVIKTILPRDLTPGTRLPRYGVYDRQRTIAVVKAVKKTKRSGLTAYWVSLEEYDQLSDHQRALAENRHLAPFYLYPRTSVEVVDEALTAAGGDHD